MKNILPFALLCSLLMLGWNCRKDVEKFNPYPNTQTELSLFLKQVPNPDNTTVFEFDGLNEDKVLATPTGIRVFLTDVDHLFASPASPGTYFPVSTCTDLKILVTIVKSKGDILAREMPTTSESNALLECGGMIEVKAFCGNSELQLIPGGTVKVQLPNNDPKDNMFVHTLSQKGWKTNGQEVFKADWPNPNGSGLQKGYELILSQLGWSSCARELSHSDVSSFCVSMQPTYTGLNTQAYLVFDNVMVVAPLTFDDASRSFCYPNIPAGYPVRVVSVTKLDSDYWLGTTTTETGTNSMLPLQAQQQEAAEVLAYLRGL